MNSVTGFYRLLLVWILLIGAPSLLQADTDSVPSLSLMDHHGESFNLNRVQGHVVLVFFGYTSCPDVCPLELSLISRVLSHYGTNNLVQGLFVSIDPKRDTLERLREYVGHFGNGLLGLTGSEQQLEEFTRYFRASYKVTYDEDDVRQVNHSSNLYVLDKQGRIDTVIPFGMTYEHIRRVVEWLLKQ